MFSRRLGLIGFLMVLMVWSSNAQTVGTLLNTAESSQNLTLIAPNTSKVTYLIDICGRVVNQWESDYVPGLAAYLDREGNLYRSGRVASPVFTGGGLGGIVEKYNWEGELVWTLDLSNDTLHQHHDFALMPNGNILALCWEKISAAEAVANGRNPQWLGDGIWPTALVEMEYGENGHFSKVWEWHAWDHIIQHHDNSKANYGIPSVDKRKIDVNLIRQGQHYEDWLHMNAVDYNAELDQILLSSRNMDEIYILDHGTTIAESRSSQGGRRGFGGDLLFRFGNNNNYSSSSSHEIFLSSQHDANWITSEEGEGNILLFNNKPMVSNGFSEVLELDFGDDNGAYKGIGSQDLTSVQVWSYNEDGEEDLYSSSISGCQRLENGNTLIIEGLSGRLIEVDDFGEVVWEYIVPVNSLGPISQYDVPFGNLIFKSRSYKKTFFNFKVDLEDNLKIELGALDDCIDYDELNSSVDKSIQAAPQMTKVAQGIEITNMANGPHKVVVYNAIGQKCYENVVDGTSFFYRYADLKTGFYTVIVYFKNKKVASLSFVNVF